jgi:O-antigen/teichoic acid export membrane protein
MYLDKASDQIKSYLPIKRIREIVSESKKQLFALSAYLLASVVSSLLSVLVNPFLAINLSHADYALLGYFTSFNSLVLPIVGFSFVTYYARNYFKFDKEKRTLTKDTILTTFLIVSPIVLIFVLFVFYIYTVYAQVSFPFSPYAYFSFIPILLAGPFSLYLTELKMTWNAKPYFYVSVSNSVIGVAFAILFVVVFQLGAWGRLFAILLTSVLIYIYCLTHFNYRIRFDKTIFFDALKFCWPLSLSAILYYFLSGIDRVMLEELDDLHTFGLYNVAFQITSYLALFGTAIIQVVDPDIFKATAENNVNKLIKITILVVVSTILPTLIYVLFANPIISLLTFGRYVEATQLSRILAFRNITTPLAFVISGIIIGYGYPKVEFVNRTIGALLSLLMYKYLILYFGFEGAAWGQVFSMLLMSFISLLFILYKVLNKNSKFQKFIKRAK